MSILIYRDHENRTVEIANPTLDDIRKAFATIALNNAAEIKREFMRKMRGSVLMASIPLD
jgi:hypothetical protein